MQSVSIINLTNQVLNDVRIAANDVSLGVGGKIKMFNGADGIKYSITFLYEPTCTYKLLFNDEYVNLEIDTTKNENVAVILSTKKSTQLKKGQKAYSYDTAGLYKKYDYPRYDPSNNYIYYGVETEFDQTDKYTFYKWIYRSCDWDYTFLAIFIILIVVVVYIFVALITTPRNGSKTFFRY